MKIYTRTGDTGETSLYGGTRVPKSSLRIDAYGTIDELNSWVGLLRDQEVNSNRQEQLIRIQESLFVIGSLLAAVPEKQQLKLPHLSNEEVPFLEECIDRMEEKLSPLKSFILPGGHPSVSFCHITRTVCRRAERLVIHLAQEEVVDGKIIPFLNRLSDYLFVLARAMGKDLNTKELPWTPHQ